MKLPKIARCLVNRVLRRKCRECRFWHDYGRFDAGRCKREAFVSLNDHFAWSDVCEDFEKKEGGDHA